jgi:cytochrome c oxidase subunit 1
MGAIFAIFAGFHHWLYLITGMYYNTFIAKVHFYVLFFGVNITFFPMHFLGLSGMPRRIPDYPECFKFYNFIASTGHIITCISMIVFFYGLIKLENLHTNCN